MADVRTHNPGRRSGVAEAIAQALADAQKPTSAAAPPEPGDSAAPPRPSAPVGVDPTMPLSAGWNRFVVPAQSATRSASEDPTSH